LGLFSVLCSLVSSTLAAEPERVLRIGTYSGIESIRQQQAQWVAEAAGRLFTKRYDELI